jgi:DNA-binding winged helix-turn-helix (wHTH) protein/Flp pilus assembly protein TadD
MDLESRPATVFRFGTFEVDVRAGELRKQGMKVRIQGQPLHLLTLLLQRPGEVVTRDELRSKIWHSDTFVDFDNGLNTSINRLREALGDSADNPRFIETLPRRGYRFIAPVTVENAIALEHPKPTSEAAVRRTPGFLTLVGVIATLTLVAGLSWRWGQARQLTEKDTIVVGDFANNTGDNVFDGTLRQGLAVQLEQSPFISLVSDERIQQTLRLMRLQRDARLTPEIAREVCERTGSTIVIAGSIAQIGTQYTLILTAVGCPDGESMTRAQAHASDKSHVLEALGQASSDLRRKLGESRATVKRFDTPLVQATTASLDALHVYSLGHKTVTAKGDSAAAIPLFQEATQLDPNFAMAYALLGSSYWNLGENTLAADNIRKAFALRADVSESERLRIESQYHALVTADLEKAQGALQVWAQTFPRDWAPRNQLGVVHMALGQHDKALAMYTEALGLYPQSSLIRGNITSSYIALNRLAEARASAREAMANNPDAPALRINLYRLAFLQSDTTGMEQQVASAIGVHGLEDVLLWNQAATEAYFGHLNKARTLYRQAVGSATRAEEREAAAGYEAAAALTAALFGNGEEARQWVASALRRSTGPDMQYRSATALALAGDVAQATTLADDLEQRFPQDTIVRFMYLPTLRAQLALGRNDPRLALEILQAAAPYAQSVELYPEFVRGACYLAAHRGGEAVSEFQKILDHPGIVLNSPIGALAHLQLGRALAMHGDMIKSRGAYHDFLALWEEADADIPVLREAKAEFERLANH